MLRDDEIRHFVDKGYVRVEGAFPTGTARQCCALALEQLEIAASPPWPAAVVRGFVDGEPFGQAANAPRLLEAVGQLLDGEAWSRRPNLGNLVVRMPSSDDPGDAGWHIDASYEGPATNDGFTWCVNYRSRDRGLLLLCLLTDVGARDAPTRLLEGSHRAMPGLLRPFGDDGIVGLQAPLPAPDGSVALATGRAGDVYVCHPFLVHAASWPHRGDGPRVVAQPPVAIDGELRLDAGDHELSIVAATVRDALESPSPAG